LTVTRCFVTMCTPSKMIFRARGVVHARTMPTVSPVTVWASPSAQVATTGSSSRASGLTVIARETSYCLLFLLPLTE
jgi:hypothetical protein